MPSAALLLLINTNALLLIGGAIGILGGRITVTFIRRVSLPSEGLYPLRTLAVSLMLYGLTTLAHGSGFLAVFIAGIVVGDARAPYKPEIARFHGALAGLAEIVAFAVLGLTVDLRIITQADVWVPGLVLGVAIMLVVRPLAVGACLVPARLRTNERIFIMIAGLKGLVPILLGEFLRAAQVPQAERLYGIVVVVTDEGVRFLLQYRGDPDEITIDDEVGIAVDRFGVPYANSRPD